jgi:hypothetical protein
MAVIYRGSVLYTDTTVPNTVVIYPHILNQEKVGTPVNYHGIFLILASGFIFKKLNHKSFEVDVHNWSIGWCFHFPGTEVGQNANGKAALNVTKKCHFLASFSGRSNSTTDLKPSVHSRKDLRRGRVKLFEINCSK